MTSESESYINNFMKNTNTEYFRAGIAQAYAEGLTLQDLDVIVNHTITGKQFDAAIQARIRLNELKPINKTPRKVPNE